MLQSDTCAWALKQSSSLFLFLFLVASASTSAEPDADRPLKAGDTVFHANFDDATGLEPWGAHDPAKVHLVTSHDGSRALTVEASTEDAPGAVMVRVPLPVQRLGGVRVLLEAMVKAEQVVEPAQPWNGVKFMLHTAAGSTPQYAQQDGVFGTFDWKPMHFSARIAPDATEAWLMFGIEATTGQVWFDDLKITVVSAPRIRPAHPSARKVGIEPILRGVMISPNLTAAEVELLGKTWGVNHVRWQLIWGGFPNSPADTATLTEYDAWLEGALQQVDALLPHCEAAGISVLIDLHTPPGGRNEASECRLFHAQPNQDKFLEVWEKIARRYKDSPAVWGYDLVNEPVEGVVAKGLMPWRALAEAAAKRVRAIDTAHAIIVEPAPWGAPGALDEFEPLDVQGIVYSVHMYEPHTFTHQGVNSYPLGVHYPGEIQGKQWSKEELRRVLQPVINFEEDYGVPVYIGEFSAIRWAPDDSAYRYLKDVIDLFEERQWSWAYHAFREWDGWSVEHGTVKDDSSPTGSPTNRELLLRTWFEKNARAGASALGATP